MLPKLQEHALFPRRISASFAPLWGVGGGQVTARDSGFELGHCVDLSGFLYVLGVSFLKGSRDGC